MKLFCAVVGGAGSAFEVNIGSSASVYALKEAIKKRKPNDLKYVDAKNLRLFLAKKNDAWLKDDDDLGAVLQSGDVTSYHKMYHGSWKLNNKKLLGPGFFPGEEVIHVLVVVPPKVAPQVTLASAVRIPDFTPLDSWDQYLAVCSLDQWEAGKVHDIPLIWQFMKTLGGCTKTKKIFWRNEEKQVASILLGRCFDEPSDASPLSFADMRTFLVGSPGSGKSVLLVMMAFYVVLKHKKNVLVYRRLTTVDQESCLLYLGYQDGTVVYFTVRNCLPDLAVVIYLELDSRQDFSDVWLLLDGFDYERIPDGLVPFKMLTSSQNLDLKQSEQKYAYSCLLPSWKKEDLFKLGREVYKFQEENMEDRFYFSGGSVRLFATEIEQMDIYIYTACSFVGKDKHVVASKKHSERLCHTFVKDTQDPEDFLYSSNWERIIDSERAINLLTNKLRSEELLRSFHWAQRAGYDSLTGLLFEICLHRLVFDNKLILNVSEYDPLKPREERYVDWKRLEMKKGGLFCSDTATEDYYNEEELRKWRDDDTLSYWYPYRCIIQEIGVIVKLRPSSPRKKCRVALLHLSIRDEHTVNEKRLEVLQDIFTAGDFDPPIYVVLCPNLDLSKKLVVKQVQTGKDACQVFVGYCEESPLENYYYSSELSIALLQFMCPAYKNAAPPNKRPRLH